MAHGGKDDDLQRLITGAYGSRRIAHETRLMRVGLEFLGRLSLLRRYLFGMVLSWSISELSTRAG